MEIPWQLQLSQRSLKKREKLRILNNFIQPPAGKVCLEVGCDTGVTGYYLRKRGGIWISAETDGQKAGEAKELLQKNIILIGEEALPFKEHSFDLIITVDFLEHIENDTLFLRELSRILKDGGVLYVTVPRRGKLLIVNSLARKAGMGLTYYGHVREGYSYSELVSKAEAAGFRVNSRLTFSRFFAELIEFLLNYLYIFFLNKGRKRDGIKGSLSPGSARELGEHRLSFYLYRFFFPLLRCISLFDRLFFFTPAYNLAIRAEKEREEEQ